MTGIRGGRGHKLSEYMKPRKKKTVKQKRARQEFQINLEKKPCNAKEDLRLY